MKYLDLAEQYRDGLIEDLVHLASIPSVKGAPQPGMPYGKGCYEALEYMLKRAESMGFTTVNLDGYLGYAEYGQGEACIAVIGHTDVVPAGSGWVNSPYRSYCVDRELICGRGVDDNKGACVAALYTLKALKDMAIDSHCRVRVIFGCDEESGMTDMEHYLSVEPQPDLVLVPDCGYPVYNRQRGVVTGSFLMEGDGGVIVSIHNLPASPFDKRAMAVAKVDFSNTDMTMGQLFDHTIHWINRFGSGQVDIAVKELSDQSAEITLRSAMNPVLCLLDALDSWFPGMVGESLLRLSRQFTADGHSVLPGMPPVIGEGFGLLQLRLTNLDFCENSGTFSFDLRIPANGDYDGCVAAVEQAFSPWPMTLKRQWRPHYIPETHPVTQFLAQCYEMATGEPARFLCNIGNNYSRFFDFGFAYGTAFADNIPTNAHSSNERTSASLLVRHMAVYIQTLELFMTEFF